MATATDRRRRRGLAAPTSALYSARCPCPSSTTSELPAQSVVAAACTLRPAKVSVLSFFGAVYFFIFGQPGSEAKVVPRPVGGKFVPANGLSLFRGFISTRTT